MALRLWSLLHSPNPLKVRLALSELGVEYETVEVNLFKGEHRRPEFAAINPHRKVPVLEDDNERIFESNAILVYLAKTRERSLPERPRPSRTSASPAVVGGGERRPHTRAPLNASPGRRARPCVEF